MTWAFNPDIGMWMDDATGATSLYPPSTSSNGSGVNPWDEPSATKPGTWTGYGPQGQGTYYLDGPNGSPGTYIGPTTSGGSGGGGSTSYNTYMTGQLGANRYTTYTDSSGNLWQIDNLDGSQSIIQKAPSNANPADKNNDGLDDTTNMALGVYKDTSSPSGYYYPSASGQLIPVLPNGSPYTGPDLYPDKVEAPPKPGTWTGYGPKGQGTYYLDGPGGTPGTFIGTTIAPPKATTTSSGGGGSSFSGGGGSSAPVRDWAGEQAAALAAQAQRDAENNAFEAAQAELNRTFQMELANANNAADQAIAEMNYALGLKRLGLDEKKFGVDAAETFGKLASSTDPLAFAAFLHAGGGNIMNALGTGADALSPAALLPAARALQAMRGLGSTPAGGTPASATPAAGGGGGEPTPTPAAPPPATPPAGEVDRVGTPTAFPTTQQVRIGRNNQANFMGETLNNYAQMTPEALRILAQTDPLAASYLGLGGSDTMNRYVTDMNSLRTQVGGTYGPNMEGFESPVMAGWNEPSSVVGAPQPPLQYVPPPPPQTGTGSYATAISGIDASTGQAPSTWGGGVPPPPNDTPNASWNGTAWVMPDGSPAPTQLSTKTSSVGVLSSATGGAPAPSGYATPAEAQAAELAAYQAAGLPYTTKIPMLAHGTMRGLSAQHANPMGLQQLGYVNHGLMGVGDAPGRNPTANGARPEIIVNPTNAPIGVIPTAQAKPMMRGLQRYAEGTYTPTDTFTRAYDPASSTTTNFVAQPAPVVPAATTYVAPAPTTTAAPAPTTDPARSTPLTDSGNTTTSISDSALQPAPTTGMSTAAPLPASPVPSVWPHPTWPTAPSTSPTLGPQYPLTGTPWDPNNPDLLPGNEWVYTGPWAQQVGWQPPPGPGYGYEQRPIGGTSTKTPTPPPTIGANVPGHGGYGVNPLTDAQLGVTPGDIPGMQEVLDLRQGTQVPNLNYYDIAFNDQAPTLQQMYFSGLQGRYGIPQQDAMNEWARYRMRGLSGSNLGLGV